MPRSGAPRSGCRAQRSGPAQHQPGRPEGDGRAIWQSRRACNSGMEGVYCAQKQTLRINSCLTPFVNSSAPQAAPMALTCVRHEARCRVRHLSRAQRDAALARRTPVATNCEVTTDVPTVLYQSGVKSE